LLEDTDALVSDVRPVVVVVEEDGPSDPRIIPKDRVVGLEDLRPADVVLGPVGGAGAVAVFGDDDGLVGKGPVDGLEVPVASSRGRRRTRSRNIRSTPMKSIFRRRPRSGAV
jgi:hypothetical protein